MAEDGEYVKVGDVEEWRWHEGHEPKVSVPKGEFDPRAVPNPGAEPEPKSEPKTTAKKKP